MTSVETEALINHFSRFGTEIHTGISDPRQNSKTEVLFCAKAASLYASPDNYDNANLSDITLNNNRYIPIVKQFNYLGSIIATNGADDIDFETRIRKASNAFGSLRKSIFITTSIDQKVKGKVYSSLVLPILLYGAECWCVTEKLSRLLVRFHNQCARVMCRTNRYQAWQEMQPMSDMYEKLSLQPITTYLTKKQPQWVGHVIRMPWERLPRKMLSCWVRSKRPRGCPKLKVVINTFLKKNLFFLTSIKVTKLTF